MAKETKPTAPSKPTQSPKPTQPLKKTGIKINESTGTDDRPLPPKK